MCASPTTVVPASTNKQGIIYYTFIYPSHVHVHETDCVTFPTSVDVQGMHQTIDHIANLQNDAWREGRGLHWCIVGRKRTKSVPLTFPPCIILGISNMVYWYNTEHTHVIGGTSLLPSHVLTPSTPYFFKSFQSAFLSVLLNYPTSYCVCQNDHKNHSFGHSNVFSVHV